MQYIFSNIAESKDLQLQAAKVLTSVFIDEGNFAWPDVSSAMKEVEECIIEPNICIGICEEDILLGWAGLRPMYEKTWELHPLVVKTQKQTKGIGTLLIHEVERIAKEKGIIGIVLGTDDEHERTSLSQQDIDEKNIFTEIESIQNIRRHPYEFYTKCGYMIVGIIPNANGIRKPDIWMWKSLI